MTGVAMYTIVGQLRTFSSSELDWLEAVNLIDRAAEAFGNSITNFHVASERYTLPTGRNVVSAQQEAIECNGALRYVATQRNVTFELQPRAEAKKIVSDNLLKKLGWHKKTKDGHANDAARHIGLWLLTHYPVLWLELTSAV